MEDVLVSQGPRGWTFTRDFSRGKIVIGPGGDGTFTRGQLRAVASVLGIPENAGVQFLDRGTFEVIGELDPV